MRNAKKLAVLLLLAVAATGCATYYQVSDVATGKTYYSRDIARKGNGAIAFKDARTNAKVTLQSSEVQTISQKQFDAGVSTPK